MCACGRVGDMLYSQDELNFMLYFSCGYGGIYIGNESGMEIGWSWKMHVGRGVCSNELMMNSFCLTCQLRCCDLYNVNGGLTI